MFTVRSLCLCLLVVLTAASTACGTVVGNNGGAIVVVDAAEDAQQAAEDAQPSDTVSADGVSDGECLCDGGSDAAPADSVADVPADVSTCTAAGCACKNGTDCDSGLCIAGDAGQVCAASCTDACPAGFTCTPVGAGKACKPAFSRLCEPCNQDADCVDSAGSTGACVAYKNGASLVGNFCGGGKCDAKTQCPAGYSCATVVSVDGFAIAQCLRDDKQCSCDARAQTQGLSTLCSTANSDGVCGGKRACSASGISTCSAQLPSGEVCDGIDNDCDGKTDNISCDDSNPCTDDACDPAAKACKHTPASAPCDDGSKCTTGDTCANGSCTGKLKNCDDGNDCTDDSCDPKSGCVSTPATGPCGAISICTVPGQCSDGSCLGAKAKNCDDGDPCTVDACDPTSGCIHKVTSAACNDGDPCTTGDNCSTGVCQGTPKNCDDTNVCTDDSCDATGCHNTPTGGPCDDSNPCTTGDVCANGVCAGKGKSCNDGNSCTNDSCDLVKGCSNVLVPGAGCDDGNPCSFGEKCDANGVCKAGTPVVCDDGNPCTADVCDGVTGVCKYTTLSGACDDGIACTVSDTCSSGTCAGTAKKCVDGNPCTTDQCDNVKGCLFTPVVGASCEDGNPCTNGDKCDGNGNCLAGAIVSCDDLNPCTADVCDLTSGACKNTNIGSACDDGNACTNKDFCAGGVCAGTAISCDDTNVCTADSCDKVKGCVHSNLTGSCSDGNPCTVGEACSSGTCQGGTAAPCDDANVCTTDACDQNSGCTHTGNNLTCSDGNPCTTGDVCNAGTGKCVSGTNQCACQTQADCDAQPNPNPCVGKLVCDTSAAPYKCVPNAATKVVCDTSKDTACSATTCDSSSGLCKANAINAGGPCTDGSACTVGDTCTNGSCVPGNPPNCDDSLLCTTDSCDPASGCKHVNNALSCDDGDACTQNDVCSGGKCAGTATVGCCTSSTQCDDNNPCTIDVCGAIGGKCTHDPVAANGQACNADSSGCTQNDMCQGGVCTAGPTPECSGLSDTCNTGTCSSTGTNTSVCVKAPKTDGLSCDDGLYCNTGETCKAGACQGGAPLDCSSAGCTQGTCDEVQKKCVGSPKPDNTPCNADNNGCTVNDVCVSGICTAGASYQCAQPVGDPCNTWGCASTGPAAYACTPTPKTIGTTCDDGLYCTVNDACDGAGLCKSGGSRDCSALNSQCASGSCDETNKTCKAANKTDGTACNDGDACTATDTCKTGVCIGSNNACGDFKVTTFKTAYTAANPSASLVDLGSGRMRAAFASNNTTLTGRSYRSDWSREWSELQMATTSSINGYTEQLSGAGPVVVPTAGGGHDVYWLSDGSGSTGVPYYTYTSSSTNACGTIGTSGDVVYTTYGNSSTAYSCYWYWANCKTVYRYYESRHVQFQHFDSLDNAVGGVTDVFSYTGSCTTAATASNFMSQLAVSPFSDGKRFVAWMMAGVAQKRIVNANGTVFKDLGTDATVKNHDAAVYQGDNSSVYVWDDGAEIWAQLYYSNGTTAGSKFQVNTNMAGVQSNPRVAYEPGTGVFVVAWNTDANGGDLQAQVFSAGGSMAGSEFTVNTTTTGFQGNARLASHADGNFVIAYEDSSGKDGAGYGILGQWFDAGGNKLGTEKVIDVTTAGDQKYVQALGLATGEVVLSWTNMADGTIYARKFNSAGQAQNGATEFIANTTKVDEQQDPAVAVAGDGSFIVAWDSNLNDGSQQGIYFQRYSASGVVVGTETLANTTTNLAQITPAIAADSVGNFVVAWDSFSQDGSFNGVFGQRFTAAGAKAGSEFQLNQYTTMEQRRPSVASLPSGKFAAVWESDGQPGGAMYDVVMRCYDANGVALANELIVNTNTVEKQWYPAIAPFADGTQKYVVVWQSYTEDGDGWGIYAQLMTSDCKLFGAPWKVNTTTTADQTWPKVAVDPTGKFVITWSSLSQDGDNYGIYAQAYDNTGTKIGTETKLNTVTAYEQSHSAIALLPSGKFVSVWQTIGEDESGLSSGWALKGGQFGVSTVISAIGLDWLFNTTYLNDQNQPAIAARPDGSIITVWHSNLQDGDKGGVIGRIQTP